MVRPTGLRNTRRTTNNNLRRRRTSRRPRPLYAYRQTVRRRRNKTSSRSKPLPVNLAGIKPRMGRMTCSWALVVIHWIDAFDSDNGWIELDNYKPEVCNVVSVGYLWPDCLADYITITGSYFPDELPNIKTVGMVTHIPTKMVQRVIVLEQPNFTFNKGVHNEKVQNF
jgi:hypothetical protein